MSDLQIWQGPWNDDPHGPYYKIPCAEYRRLLADAQRYRLMRSNVGREHVIATPGASHDLLITLKADGCERYLKDGAVDFPATLDAIMDDEKRIRERWCSSPPGDKRDG